MNIRSLMLIGLSLAPAAGMADVGPAETVASGLMNVVEIQITKALFFCPRD